MKSRNDPKLKQAYSLLSAALKSARKNSRDQLKFAALSKTFEVAFEYAWKLFKRSGDQAGMEVYSPRDALKAAAQLKLIEDLELWDSFLNMRNLSVHDYIGVENEEFLPIVERFEGELKRILE